MKHKFRNEAKIDYDYRIKAAIQALESGPFPFKNCLNCINFNQDTEICKLANMRPPAKILIYSCEQHDDNEDIPF